MFSVARRRLTTAMSGAALLAMAAACSPGASNGTASPPAGLGAPLQPAATSADGMATFTDPTENAFTVSAPQGWTVKGGIQRTAASAQPWMTATSPDGATTIRIGDPSIPLFTLPGPFNANGTPYENSLQFAADYAQRAYGSSCAGLSPAGSQAEPALAQQAQSMAAQASAQMGAPSLNIAYDGGSETFSCQAGGAPATVGVIDVTALFRMANGGGSWNVPTLITYQTPTADQAQTDRIARAIKASYQANQQWQAQQLAAAKQQYAANQQQAAAAQAALTQQEGAESQMLRSQAQAANAQLAANHAAFMQQQASQAASRNAGFAQQMYNKQTGQDAEMRYINNQVCIRWYDAAHTRCAATAQQ